MMVVISMSKDETKPVEPKPVPTTPRGKLLAHFDEMLDQLGQYYAKFADHIKGMEVEIVKVMEAKKSLEAKIKEVSELREFVEKRMK
jgi:hypothetical protein